MGESRKVWGSFENASSAMARRVAAVGIDSTDKPPLQDSQRIKLGRPEPHHKFWTPRDIGASYFNATANSQLTITNPTRGSFVTLMSPIEG